MSILFIVINSPVLFAGATEVGPSRIPSCLVVRKAVSFQLFASVPRSFVRTFCMLALLKQIRDRPCLHAAS